MRNARTYVSARLRRGFGLRSLGPNEARVLFDAAVAFGAAVVAALVSSAFVRHEPPALTLIAAVLLAPVVAVGSTAAVGVYGRFRSASGRVKAACLASADILAAALLGALTRDPAFVVVWLAVAAPPAILARLLLAVAHGSRRTAVNIAVNDRGPVLVIGGAGYIGTHAVEQLLAGGHAVRVLDRLMYGDGTLRDFEGNPRFEFIEGDAADISKLTVAMRGASAVVHLAGLVGDPACAVDPDFTRHTNIVVTRMVRTVAASMGVRRFVFASSCSVYGVSDDPVSELSALNPVSLYAQTKIDSERELLTNVPDGFYTTVLRFATVFGHSRRARFDLVGNLFTAQAVNDGLITVIGPHQWRPFVHVRDLGRAIAAVISADAAIVQNQVFNVGDERLNTTILQLAETVKSVVEELRPVSITVTENPDDLRNYAVSFEKIRAILGFRAEVTLEQGIREMVRHHRAGTYQDYHREAYSNVAMTRRAVERFQDPEELSHIYAPLAR
ncbi:MAG TPA: NAD(P)-dependent oxidoreductase [Candidatus Elarobacter sp.]